VLERPRDQFEIFRRREQKLQRWAWASILLPVGLLIALFVMVGKELQNLNNLERLNKEQQDKIARNAQTLANQQTQLDTNNLALSAVKAQRRGPSPRIVYYRSSIGNQLLAALDQLGFSTSQGNVQEETQEANVTLSGKDVDTLIYGCAVSEQDLRLIAAALNNAHIPIRRIAPAVKKRDPLLVQIVASKRTDAKAEALNLETWKKPAGCQAK
jgi:hypothetical protein